MSKFMDAIDSLRYKNEELYKQEVSKALDTERENSRDEARAELAQREAELLVAQNAQMELRAKYPKQLIETAKVDTVERDNMHQLALIDAKKTSTSWLALAVVAGCYSFTMIMLYTFSQAGMATNTLDSVLKLAYVFAAVVAFHGVVGCLRYGVLSFLRSLFKKT